MLKKRTKEGETANNKKKNLHIQTTCIDLPKLSKSEAWMQKPGSCNKGLPKHDADKTMLCICLCAFVNALPLLISRKLIYDSDSPNKLSHQIKSINNIHEVFYPKVAFIVSEICIFVLLCFSQLFYVIVQTSLCMKFILKTVSQITKHVNYKECLCDPYLKESPYPNLLAVSGHIYTKGSRESKGQNDFLLETIIRDYSQAQSSAYSHPHNTKFSSFKGKMA